jgi:F-type H+-transporting ATPase subunit epsilon
MLNLKIITPQKIVVEEEVNEISVPSAEGYITVLPKHIHLLTLLQEGIVLMKKGTKEDYLAIGGGYLETNGKEVNVLVSRAYRQDELDEELTEKAIAEAKKLLSDAKDAKLRYEAEATLRRSVVDMKLIKRRRRSS